MRPSLPYFDLLLEGRRRGDPASRLFERYVHWGYWEEPGSATLAPEEFQAAAARLDAEVLAAADLKDGQSILDAGCGFGGTLEAVGKAFPRAERAGLNIDARQLEIARAAVPGARFVEGDACAMPFPDASFDRVLAVECIFHFPSRLRFLKEAARVLRPGGRVALSDFVPLGAGRSGGGPVGRWLEAEIAEGYGGLGDAWKDGNYAEMARAAGLRVTLDRDITANTLPTYPVLLEALKARRDEPLAARMLLPTRLLDWLSRLRVVRYRVVAFARD